MRREDRLTAARMPREARETWRSMGKGSEAGWGACGLCPVRGVSCQISWQIFANIIFSASRARRVPRQQPPTRTHARAGHHLSASICAHPWTPRHHTRVNWDLHSFGVSRPFFLAPCCSSTGEAQGRTEQRAPALEQAENNGGGDRDAASEPQATRVARARLRRSPLSPTTSSLSSSALPPSRRPNPHPKRKGCRRGEENSREQDV